MGMIGCPETSVRNYHSTLCKIPKEDLIYVSAEAWYLHATVPTFHAVNPKLITKEKVVPDDVMKTYKGRRVRVPLILNLGTGWGWEVEFTLRLFYPRERTHVTIDGEAGWAQELAWTGIQTLDLSARSLVTVQIELPNIMTATLNKP